MKKREYIQLVETLQEANNLLLEKDISFDEATVLFQKCQETALFIGNSIESGETKVVQNLVPDMVKLLEDYCENIYQMSMSFSDEKHYLSISKKISEQMKILIEMGQKNIPDDKKIIAFLPYKASMWDSLESIWQKANADPDIDAYVIPIPYYDKNPDGTVKTEHYEGDLYPEYVPITDYHKFDFERIHPDMIYIHNPYDECNYVTSVYPFFYSKNLKQYTDMLVYVPYFILQEIEPENESAIENMAHFVTLPGVFNADRIIVQSEKMRQVYIKVLTDLLMKNNAKEKEPEVRAYWEKRIVGWGSPKIEKILNTKKEDLNIPEEWMRIIQKPDGNYKKIILYNTSISGFLQYKEKMLEKMQSVFQIFKENKDRVALLWRPHPLIESTLVSMLPELWEDYKRIRNQYRAEGWGIYDDTADMDRAIALSDAYYGDPSSLVELYRSLGKMIMIQTPEIIEM